ncbi:hypothetical protein ACOMHN_017082 [Nucella lapillus]
MEAGFSYCKGLYEWAPAVGASNTYPRVSEADLADEPRSVMDRLGPGSDPVPLGSPPSLPSTSCSGAAIFTANLVEADMTRDDVPTQAFTQLSVTASPHSSRAAAQLPPPLTIATSEALREMRVSPSPLGAVEKPMPMGGPPLPHWAPPFDGSALEGAVGGPS